MNWPNDADGDVLRRLEESGFDFSKSYEIDFNIDFNIDFDNWPPSEDAIELIDKEFGTVEVYNLDEDHNGYLLFNINRKITYDLVINTQKRVSKLLQSFGGVCESWGILH
ncbi:MAG: hypothetical protein ACJAS9_003835 [Polaribacter sp.]